MPRRAWVRYCLILGVTPDHGVTNALTFPRALLALNFVSALDSPCTLYGLNVVTEAATSPRTLHALNVAIEALISPRVLHALDFATVGPAPNGVTDFPTLTLPSTNVCFLPPPASRRRAHAAA